MSKVTKTFTFKVPDDYTLQEAENDSSVSFTYHGPQYLHVHLNKENKFQTADETTLNDWLEEEARDEDHSNCLLINALAQPLEASIFWAMKDSDIADLPQRVKTGPDGVTYQNPWPLPPHKAYEPHDMEWDPNALTWKKPYPWHKPWSTWLMIDGQAQAVAQRCQQWLDDNDSDGVDADLVAAWTQCKTEAENKTEAYASAGFLPHEVSFRLTPEDSDAMAAHDPSEDPDSA